MKNASPILICLLIASFIAPNKLGAQNTFERILSGVGHIQNQGITATSDGGNSICGIMDNGSASRIFISKLDCKGEVEWTNLYQNSSTINNISQRVVELPNEGYVLATNMGTYQNYNMLVIRLDADGNTLWQKGMLGNRDDVLNDAVRSPDGGIVISGATNTYGQDKNTSSLTFKDVYITKLDSDGNLLWSKTFGTASTVDEGTTIINTQDGGYALTGRYIDRGAFQILLLKLDGEGELDFIRTYGDTLQRNYAYGILQNAEGEFLISGSTTLHKGHFNDPPDPCLLKISAEGDLIWARTYIPQSNDHSDSGSAVLETDDGYVISMPTISFQSPGSIVPNKFALIHTDKDGHMTATETYTNGYSHYPEIAKIPDGSGYYLAGFGTEITTTFSPHIIRLDNTFGGACNKVDRSTAIVEAESDFIEKTPETVEGTGANWVNINGIVDTYTFESHTLCESIVEECELPSALMEVDKMQLLALYPNPVERELGFSIPQGSARLFQVQIIHTDGRLIRSERLNTANPEQHLDVSDLPKGVYVLRLWNEEQWYGGQFVKM